MAAVHKFLFDTSFDAGESAEPRATAAAPTPDPAPAAEPEIDAQALEDARAESRAAGFAEGEATGRKAGYEEGRAAGREEAHQAGAHLSAEALGALDRQLRALAADRETMRAEAERAALAIARAALAKLFPVLAAEHGLAETEAVLAECLARLGEEPRVVVRVPDAYYDALDAEIPALAKRSGFEGKVVLLSEPSLQPGDLRVEWADGGAEREVASLAAEIDAVLCRASAPEPSETTDPTDDAGASEVPDETSPAPPPEAAAEPQEG